MAWFDNVAGSLPNPSQQTADALVQQTQQAVDRMVDGIVNSLNSGIRPAEIAGQRVGEAFSQGVLSTLPHARSTGEHIAKGVVDSIDENIKRSASSGLIGGVAGGLIVGVFREIENIGGGIFRGIRNGLEDLIDTATAFGSQANMLKGLTGFSYGQSGELLQQFGAFGINPVNLFQGSDYAIKNMIGGNLYGLPDMQSPDFLTGYASRYQEMMSGDFLSRMMAQSMSSTMGMNNPQGMFLANLPADKIQEQLDWTTHLQENLGLTGDAITRFAQDLPLAQLKISTGFDHIKLSFMDLASPAILHALDYVTDYIGQHGQDIKNALIKAVDWTFTEMPLLVITGFQHLIHGTEWFIDRLMGGADFIQAHVGGFLTGIDAIGNGVRELVAILQGSAAAISAFFDGSTTAPPVTPPWKPDVYGPPVPARDGGDGSRDWMYLWDKGALKRSVGDTLRDLTGGGSSDMSILGDWTKGLADSLNPTKGIIDGITGGIGSRFTNAGAAYTKAHDDYLRSVPPVNLTGQYLPGINSSIDASREWLNERRKSLGGYDSELDRIKDQIRGGALSGGAAANAELREITNILQQIAFWLQAPSKLSVSDTQIVNAVATAVAGAEVWNFVNNK